MKEFLDKFLRFLQSNQAILLAAMMSLATQLWHSVRAFVALDVGGAENLWNYLFGILFSVSTSFAILIFTVRGRKWLAYFFLLVEVFINIIHYNLMNMEGGSLLWATLFMCVIVPVTISVYSSEVEVEIEPKIIPVPVKETKQVQAIGMDDAEFIKEVNERIGFSIIDPDNSKKLSQEVMMKLRTLWKQRRNLKSEDLKSEIKKILNAQPIN